MKKQTKALDLGVLQDDAIAAAKAVQLAQSAALKAIAAHSKAEEAHIAAQKTLAAAFESVRQATKVL